MWRWTKRVILFVGLAFVALQSVLHVPRMVAFYYWTVANRTDVARSWQEASLAINEHGGWFARETLGWDLFNLADLYDRIGEHGRIEPLLLRAEDHLARTQGRNAPAFAFVQGKFGHWHRKYGRYGEAERRYKRALEIWEAYFSSAKGNRRVSLMEQAWLWVGRRYLESSSPFWRRMYLWWETALPFDGMRGWVDNLTHLAALYEITGRPDEAWRLYTRTAGLNVQLRPSAHPDTAFQLHREAVRHHNAGRYRDALDAYTASLTNLRLNFGAENAGVVNAELQIARVKQHMGRDDGVETALKKVVRIREASLSPDHLDLAYARQELAEYYRLKGDRTRALAHLRPALDSYGRVLGDDHPSTVFARTLLAYVHMNGGDDRRALRIARRAFKGLLQRRPTQSGFERARGRDPNFLRAAIESFILAAYRVRRKRTRGSRRLKRESFLAAQAFQHNGASQALNQLAVRTSARQAPLRDMIRRGQDQAARWRRLDSALTQALQDPDLERQQARIERLRAAMRRSERIARAIDDRLNRDFPLFGELARPTAMSIEEVQEALRFDELLVRFIPFHTYTMIWAISKDRARWTHVDIKLSALRDHVDALRCGLDRKSWHGEAGLRCIELIRGNWDPETQALPFRRARARQLYTALFGPLKTMLQNRKLLIVSSGVLSSLPFNVLIGESADEGATAWLGLEHAITVLPSVSALRGLRRHIARSEAEYAFLGVGNPVLEGNPDCPAITIPKHCGVDDKVQVANLDRSAMRGHMKPRQRLR